MNPGVLMKIVINVDLLEFMKREDGVSIYRYKVKMSNGTILEGDDFVTVYKNVNKAKESIVGFLNDYYSDFE